MLFTNNTLGAPAGTETYLRDVAKALLRRGHHPVAFSLVLGPVAEELRRLTVPVVDDLARLTVPPDVIHGHHHLETLMAALKFPDVPIVHFCHGWIPWEEMPLHHPSIRRYVAVDEVCLDRLVREEGIPIERTEMLLNFVDLDRFRQRETLPAQPRRALVLSNQATSDGYTRTIERACAAHGVSLDVVGLLHGNPTDAPERLLAKYDLVFAKGRAALEGLAVGCGVVLADAVGCGPLVTPDNFDQLRIRNFGIRELNHAHDVGWYSEQIARYDADASARVSARVRAEAGLDAAVDHLLTIYTEAIATPADAYDPVHVAGDYLRRIASPLKQAWHLHQQVDALRTELRQKDAELRQRDVELRQKDAEFSQKVAELRQKDAKFSQKDAELRLLQTRVGTIFRIRDGILRIPLLGTAIRGAWRYVAGWLQPDVASHSL